MFEAKRAFFSRSAPYRAPASRQIPYTIAMDILLTFARERERGAGDRAHR